MSTVCEVLVSRSRTDWDAHGSFWSHWQERCNKPVSAFGRCAEHHAQHVRQLKVSADHHDAMARSARAELSALTGEVSK